MSAVVLSGGHVLGSGANVFNVGTGGGGGNQILGLNSNAVNYFSSELPFLNIVKSGGISAGIMVSAYNWITRLNGGSDTGEEYQLNLNSDGYPLQIPQSGLTSNQVQCVMNNGMSATPGAAYPYAYPNVSYTVQFSGAGTLVFSGDASATITASGQTFTVATPTGSGISLTITASTLGNPITNLSVVETPLVSSYNAGAIFHPNFLAIMQQAPPTCFRFMGWQATNATLVQITFASAPSGATSGTISTFYFVYGGSPTFWPGPTGTHSITFSDGEVRNVTLTNGSSTATWSGALGTVTTTAWMDACGGWSSRSLESNCFWGNMNPGQFPMEVGIALCNQAGMNMWVNVPFFFSNSDITSLMTLIYNTLNTNLTCYVEYSNEIWNSGYQQFNASQAAGYGLTTGLPYPSYYQHAWIGVRNAYIANICATVYGSNFSRCIPVFGAFIDGTDSVSLAFGFAVSLGPGIADIKAVAIAPYFPGDLGGSISSADATTITSQSDGGQSYLLQCFTSSTMVGGSAPGLLTSVQTNYGSGGFVGLAYTQVQSYISFMAANYPSIALCGYEGGQQLDGGQPSAHPFGNTLIAEVNRSATMGTIFTTFFNWWKSNVGAAPINVLNVTNDIGIYGNNAYGLLESAQQPISPLSSAPAKWQAFVNYIQG